VTAREVLDGIKVRLSELEGPWEARSESPSMDGGNWTFRRAGKPGIIMSTHMYGHGSTKAEFIASAPATVARLTAAVEAVLALADRLKSEAENAEHGARAAAEVNDGAALRAWESEKYTYQQAERLIRAAIENALEGE
jgi:hypothetical protein